MAIGVLSSCEALPDGDAGAEDSPIRELVKATDVDPGADVVEVTLVAKAGVVELQEGRPTSVLGYADGPSGAVTVPGPMIEATVGDRLIVHFRNELPGLTTTVHWHGLRLPVAMDGNPMVSGVVEPGQTFEYDFVLRDAGLFWYHPHVDTDEQLELGLQGLLLVREREPPAVDQERIFALDDVALHDDGSVDLDLGEDDAMLGRRGPVITVNGGPPGTVIAQPGALERWRFVNTANGRYFDLQADGLSMQVIGWDGGLVAEPYEVSSLRVAPGERYDVLVRMPLDTASIDLRTLEVARGATHRDQTAQLVRFLLEGQPLDHPLPTVGRAIAPLNTTAGQTLGFVLRSDLEGPSPAYFINDQRWPLNVPLEVRLGDTDVWEVVNEEPHHHPFHVHGLFFQVLDVDGVSPPALGWKDTVDIPPESTTRLAVTYGEPGMWMYHCQIPEHAERGMMGDLLVEP